MAVADWSGQAWLQGFNEAGLVVFGKTADEIHDIKASMNIMGLFLVFTTIM
jgi:replication factor A1